MEQIQIIFEEFGFICKLCDYQIF